MNSKVKQKVFGDEGYSADMRLDPQDLDKLRRIINDHWLATISAAYPELAEEAARLGIENYHLISDRIDHKKLWTKTNRVLPQEAVTEIKKMPFIARLKEEFGEFEISDVYDVQQRPTSEEIYWRLVRPEVPTDVGLLHADKWFHIAVGMGPEMFPVGKVSVKVWIPIYCEPGKNGLAIVPGSHHRQWKFHVEYVDGLGKPIIDEDTSKIPAELMHTEPGNMLIFHENTLHGGVVNHGRKTRVSMEITMLMPDVPLTRIRN